MQRDWRSILTTAGCLLTLSQVCLTWTYAQGQGRLQGDPAARHLVAAKAKVMSADYGANLPELTHAREEIAPLMNDRAVGYLAHYWAGFASWRIAINGANRGMEPHDLRAHLERAAMDFDASIHLRDDFADGYAAGASVNGWLIGFYGEDAAGMREHVVRTNRLLARAKELAPDNPRVLWVEGGNSYFKPPEYGGSQERGVQLWSRALELSDVPGLPNSPLPDWGKPEALMALAFAHLNQAAPDLASAAAEAHAALRLQPEWSYVRDILLPQIEAAAHKATGPTEQPALRPEP